MRRRIIQLESIVRNYDTVLLYGLCNDGSIWYRHPLDKHPDNRKWQRVPEEVPQPEIIRKTIIRR